MRHKLWVCVASDAELRASFFFELLQRRPKAKMRILIFSQ